GLVAPGFSQEAFTERKIDGIEPLKYGPFDALFGIRGGVVYDDNIYISPNKKSDVIWTIAPNVTLAAGDYRAKEANFLTLSYTPSVILFSDQTRNDALDHEAVLNGQWRPGAWKFGL